MQFNQHLLPPRYTMPVLSPCYQHAIVSTNKLEHINCIIAQNDGVGGLYLGDIITLFKQDILHSNHIQSIVSCLTQQQFSRVKVDPQYVLKHIQAKDTMDYNINIHFEQCFRFIDCQRKNGKNVLVQCHAGISRSATIVCAYLMLKNKWDHHQALNYIKLRRERSKPNFNFYQQLALLTDSIQKQKSKSITKTIDSSPNSNEYSCSKQYHLKKPKHSIKQFLNQNNHNLSFNQTRFLSMRNQPQRYQGLFIQRTSNKMETKKISKVSLRTLNDFLTR